jgi:hypothetical protein
MGILLTFAMLVGAVFWDMAIQGNTWMNFYGRVVDARGNGIPGVNVTFAVSSVDFFSLPVPFYRGPEQGVYNTTMVSDSDGNFQLLWCHGVSLRVNISESTGYIVDVKLKSNGTVDNPATLFTYSGGQTSANLPTTPDSRITYRLLPSSLPHIGFR